MTLGLKKGARQFVLWLLWLDFRLAFKLLTFPLSVFKSSMLFSMQSTFWSEISRVWLSQFIKFIKFHHEVTTLLVFGSNVSIFFSGRFSLITGSTIMLLNFTELIGSILLLLIKCRLVLVLSFSFFEEILWLLF